VWCGVVWCGVVWCGSASCYKDTISQSGQLPPASAISKKARNREAENGTATAASSTGGKDSFAVVPASARLESLVARFISIMGT